MKLTEQLKARQVPGRFECLGMVANGTATELQKRIAGLKQHPPRPALPFYGLLTIGGSGIERLTAQERAKLPF